MDFSRFEGVLEMFQNWSVKRFIRQREIRNLDAYGFDMFWNGCASRFIKGGLLRTKFHCFEYVKLPSHLNYCTIQTTHRWHDAVRTDGHETEKFQKPDSGVP